MRIDNHNYKQFTFLILILILISTSVVYFVDFCLKTKGVNVPFYIGVPSISAVYYLFFYLFDNYFWKWKIFKKLNVIIADDLNGVWEGIGKSSHDNFEHEIKIILTIKQSATNIVIHGLFNESKSISLNANFAKSEIDNSVALFYFYKNEPKYDSVTSMAMHEGAVKLIYNKEKNTLEGAYFSGRNRNNFGKIEVKKKK